MWTSQLHFTEQCNIAQRQWIGSESDHPAECARVAHWNTKFSLQSLFPFWSKTISRKDYSWSQNKAGLIRGGLVICTDAPRMTSYHIGFRFPLLEVFMKNLRLDFPKPLEDRKPSQEFTTTFHLQHPVVWWEFLSSWGPPHSLRFLSLPGSDLPHSPVRLGTLWSQSPGQSSQERLCKHWSYQVNLSS